MMVPLCIGQKRAPPSPPFRLCRFRIPVVRIEVAVVIEVRARKTGVDRLGVVARLDSRRTVYVGAAPQFLFSTFTGLDSL